MRALIFSIVILCAGCFSAQLAQAQNREASSMLTDLATGDSLMFYQCHVEEATQQVTTASGQTLTGKAQKCSITEKFVLIREQNGFRVNYYTSSLVVFPNKKFSGLKIRERPYWAFKREKTKNLSEQDVKVFLALEKRGRQAMEYDFAITRYTTNQIIIKHKKNFKQLVIDGNYVISKLIAI